MAGFSITAFPLLLKCSDNSIKKNFKGQFYGFEINIAMGAGVRIKFGILLSDPIEKVDREYTLFEEKERDALKDNGRLGNKPPRL